jgi:DNA-binding NarL/FixJ family response regulator
MMSEVFIVDSDAKGLSADLNAISKDNNHGITFTPFATPERLFDELRQTTPDLILLHHHWPGLNVRQLLERIVAVQDSVRVIVFTGQPVDIRELVDCVRFGAADYWTERGNLEPSIVFRKIDYYCSSDAWTMNRLRMPSGSQQQLLIETEGAAQRVEALELHNHALSRRVMQLENEEGATLLRTVLSCSKFLILSIILVGAFVVAKGSAYADAWESLGLVALLALLFLFSEGRLAELWIKWNGGSARVKTTTSQPRSPSASV